MLGIFMACLFPHAALLYGLLVRLKDGSLLLNLLLSRLTLAAMSPLLARVMNSDAEEPDYITVEGAELDHLREMVHILYKGRLKLELNN